MSKNMYNRYWTIAIMKCKDKKRYYNGYGRNYIDIKTISKSFLYKSYIISWYAIHMNCQADKANRLLVTDKQTTSNRHKANRLLVTNKPTTSNRQTDRTQPFVSEQKVSI